MNTTTRSLDTLVDELRTEFRREARGLRIAELLRAYTRQETDWRAYALWDDAQYTRNLIAREDRFELLLLCWGPGHESPIHNHEGQDCWMGVLEGEIEEVRYCRHEEVRPGPLEPRGTETFPKGDVTYIRDEIGLHLVRPAQRDLHGASLHLYAAPYDSCNVYCPETGRVARTPLTDYSFRGRPVDGP